MRGMTYSELLESPEQQRMVFVRPHIRREKEIRSKAFDLLGEPRTYILACASDMELARGWHQEDVVELIAVMRRDDGTGVVRDRSHGTTIADKTREVLATRRQELRVEKLRIQLVLQVGNQSHLLAEREAELIVDREASKQYVDFCGYQK